MKSNKMFDAMSKIDDKYINRAAQKREAAITKQRLRLKRSVCSEYL